MRTVTRPKPGPPRYLVIFGPLGQVKGGVDFRSALLAEGRQLEGDWLSQAVTGLQLELGRLHRDLMEVSEEVGHKSRLQGNNICMQQFTSAGNNHG